MIQSGKKKNGKHAKALTQDQLASYLAAVDRWQQQDGEDVTDNLCSLLKDSIVNDDMPEQDCALFSTDTETTNSNHHAALLHAMAQKKALAELNALYEDYTYATAKDASITDDLRRELLLETSTTTTTTTTTTNDDVDIQQEHYTPSEDSLVYGEVQLEGFCNLLWHSLPPKALAHHKHGIFYDLGSGSGKAVFAARFIGDFQQCIGIEVLPNLHQLARSVSSLYKFVHQHKLAWQAVSFVGSDLRQYDWSNGTVVYVPNLLFDTALMQQIAIQAVRLQSGAYLISLKPFPKEEDDVVLSTATELFHDAFQLVHSTTFETSWGDASAYIYRRI